MSEVCPARLCRRLLLVSVAVLPLVASPLSGADQLRLDALVQEGDLILEEAKTLTPADEQLAQEEQRLVASESALRDEVQSLNQTIAQFNAAMAQHNRDVQAYQGKCGGKATADKALEDACDARGLELREQVNLLEEERSQLRARQAELNARVDKQNAWAQDYAKRKGAQTSRDKLNQRDSEDWLGRAKQFFASADFAALLAQTGSPPACSADQITEIATLSARPALEGAQACLKAIKEASR